MPRICALSRRYNEATRGSLHVRTDGPTRGMRARAEARRTRSRGNAPARLPFGLTRPCGAAALHDTPESHAAPQTRSPRLRASARANLRLLRSGGNDSREAAKSRGTRRRGEARGRKRRAVRRLGEDGRRARHPRGSAASRALCGAAAFGRPGKPRRVPSTSSLRLRASARTQAPARRTRSFGACGVKAGTDAIFTFR